MTAPREPGAGAPARPAGAAGTTAGPTASGAACAACGAELVVGARFCEACGRGVGTPPPGGCDRCGAPVGADGYCTSCGHRALEAVTVDDRGPLAYAGHRGRRHPRNEDSCALGTTGEGWPVVAVADGVSASPNPHRASAAAATAAARRLVGRPFTGPDDLVGAVAAAHRAVSAVSADDDPDWPADGSHPACTLAVAVATPTAVHVANVGDARAYVLTSRAGGWGATQVSSDDSVAAHAVAGGIDADVALALGGHGVTAWLGADAAEPAPHVGARPCAPGDLVMACSDGLWNYAPTDRAMGDLAASLLAPPPRPGVAPRAAAPGAAAPRAAAPGAAAPRAAAPRAAAPLGAGCERLVRWALDQGGADNVTVALAAVPPPRAGDPDPHDPEEAP